MQYIFYRFFINIDINVHDTLWKQRLVTLLCLYGKCGFDFFLFLYYAKICKCVCLSIAPRMELTVNNKTEKEMGCRTWLWQKLYKSCKHLDELKCMLQKVWCFILT